MVETQGAPSNPKICYQRRNSINVGDMERKFATLVKKKSSMNMCPHRPANEISNCIPPNVSPLRKSDFMETNFISSSTDSQVFKGGIIQSVLAPKSKNEKKVMLKRCRIDSFSRTQDRKRSNMKVKIQGHQSDKPVEVFSSLLFPKNNRKHLKQMSLNCGSLKSTNYSGTEGSALYPAG